MDDLQSSSISSSESNLTSYSWFVHQAAAFAEALGTTFSFINDSVRRRLRLSKLQNKRSKFRTVCNKQDQDSTYVQRKHASNIQFWKNHSNQITA